MHLMLLKWTPRVLGFLFLYAAVAKLNYPVQAMAALESIGLRPNHAEWLIIDVTAIELYLAVILILQLNLRWGLALSMGVMSAFSVFLFCVSFMSSPPACGCLGLSQIFSSTRHEALFGLLRNCVILWALKFSYDYYFGRGPMPGADAASHPAPVQTA